MEFILKQEIKVEKTTEDGKEIKYGYKFKGTEDSNKSSFTLWTEKPLKISEGATIKVNFKDSQTKI